MSFFYLTAVKGDIPVHLLEVIALNRLEYLKAILKDAPPVFSEYVIEGSIYDNVGHFMLCIAASLNENIEFSRFFIKAEIELFKRRLKSLSAYDMRIFAKKILRYTKKYKTPPSFIYPLKVLCEHLALKDIVQHVSSFHGRECFEHNIKVNFIHCLSFVSKREVELNKGIASVPCGKWKQYLILLFKNNLLYKINTNFVPVKSDSRINELLLKIKKEFFPFLNKANALLSKDVDNVSNYFPPCMLNLHRNLRTRHRLSHDQRFYYSLFLKDIGMPIEEAISFWKDEYKLSPNGNHSCCHNWEKDEKKYLYGIRHMYGLEGCRKSYRSVNCQRIQSNMGACSEGGCPFKAFDTCEMLKLLKEPIKPLLPKIQELKKNNRYTSACMLTLNINDCDNFPFNFTPVQYFMISSNILSNIS